MLLRSVLLVIAISAPVWAVQETEQNRESDLRRTNTAVPRLVAVPRVGRGERVSVEVTSGSARLAFEATAESSGRVGNFVLVRNPANGRLFQAKVAAKGKVIVQK